MSFLRLAGQYIILIVCLVWASMALALAQEEAPSFDYYILALSWSPAYCATVETERSSQQCSSSTTYGFIVHGLWPQYEAGGYPEKCGRRERVPESVITQTLPVMPDKGLIIYQWRKHGACTRLSPETYFSQISRLFNGLSLKGFDPQEPLSPRQARSLFLQANPDIPPEAVRLSCKKGTFSELRVCLSQDSFTPRACPADLPEGCSFR